MHTFTKVQKTITKIISALLIIILLNMGVSISRQTAEELVLGNTIETDTPKVSSYSNDREIGTVTKVTDGDTIRVQLGDQNISVRLIGIDTPEISHPKEPVQCYGPEAQEALEKLILNKEIKLEKDVSDTDRFGRSLRYVWLEDMLINEYLTENGFAFASAYPPDTKYQDKISQSEQSAKINERGLWSKDTCNGDVYTTYTN